MYDAMNEPHEFVGENREDASARACKYFGVALDALEITSSGRARCMASAGAARSSRRRATGAPVARGGERGERGDRPRARRARRSRRPRRSRGSRSIAPGRGDRGEGGGGRGGDGPRRGMDRGGEGRGAARSEGCARGSRSRRRGAKSRAPRAHEPSIGTPRGELGEVGALAAGRDRAHGARPVPDR